MGVGRRVDEGGGGSVGHTVGRGDQAEGESTDQRRAMASAREVADCRSWLAADRVYLKCLTAFVTDCTTVDPDSLQRVFKKVSGRTDKRMACPILDVARLLSHEHEGRRPHPPLPEHRLSSLLIEIAPLAVLCLGAVVWECSACRLARTPRYSQRGPWRPGLTDRLLAPWSKKLLDSSVLASGKALLCRQQAQTGRRRVPRNRHGHC